MTSKEALQKLLLSLYIPTRDVRDINKDVELIDIIKKDLEALEKLKSILKVSDNDGYIGFYTDGYINNKEILEIKEWLEKCWK